MSVLSIGRTYKNGSILLEADFDIMKNSIETKVNTTKLDNDNFQNVGITGSSKLVDLSVTTGKLKDALIETVKIIDDAVTGAQLPDNVVDSAHYNADSVTTAKIASNTITTDKFNDGSVTTDKINDGVLTRSKLASLGQQLSVSLTTSTTSTSFTAVTSGNVSITTTGRPVFVGLIGDGTGVLNYIRGATASSTSTTCQFQLKRDSTVLGVSFLNYDLSALMTADLRIPPSCIWYIDQPSAGTYTYSIEYKTSSGTAYLEACKLIAFEF